MNSVQTAFDRAKFDISGMTCVACAARIEKVVRKMDGIETIHVNLALNRAAVVYDKQKLTVSRITDAIEALGFGAHNRSEGAIPAKNELHDDSSVLLARLWMSLLLTLPFVWAMAAHHSWSSAVWVPELLVNPWFQLALATVVQFGVGLPFYMRAYQSLRHGTANMDVLIVIGTSAAYLYSHYLLFHSHNAADAHRGHGTMLYFDTSAMIFTIVLFGKWIESHARTYTQAGFRGLSEQLAGTVTVMRSGASSDSVKLPAADVRAGDIVLLAPGEKALVDGIVLEGTADMDEAMVTGESASIGKSPGDTIISGSINRNGLLKVAVTAAGDGTFLASMVRLLEDAQISKAPIERLADRISGYFIPVIVGLSILAFGLSYWVFAAESFGSALERAIAVLLIACPCALGLATPVSVLVGTGRASAAGVMMKEGRYLESLCSIDTILLDKTGTLTHGKPMVAKLWTLNRSEDALLRTMAAVEKHSEHPYGAAIVYEAERRKLQLPECTQVETIPGCGIRAVVNGERIEIGSFSWMEKLGVRLPELYKSVLQQSVRNQTLLFTASNGRCIGMAALSDKVRQTSPETIERLGSMGIRVLMVTGDRMEPARAVAEQLNIPEVYAEMMPQDKVELVHRLQQEGRKVAMIGDGLNDAAALSASHVGIAMGAGNDLTKASADVYIVRNDLLGVVEAVRLSRLTIRNIKQNLVLSLAYNGIAIPFAMMGLLAPWMACSAMALSSVTVIGNALRLKRG